MHRLQSAHRDTIAFGYNRAPAAGGKEEEERRWSKTEVKRRIVKRIQNWRGAGVKTTRRGKKGLVVKEEKCSVSKTKSI